MRRHLMGAMVAAALAGCAGSASAPGTAAPDPALAARVAALEARTARLQDIRDIKRLQHSYGYYLSEGQWDDVARLFADDATLEMGRDGVYRGRERIREWFRLAGGATGANGLAPGQLHEHLQAMPVITPEADGMHARGTWRTIILTGTLGRNAFWGEGPAEMRYVKQDGTWKIASMQWFQSLYVPYETGWGNTADVNGGRYVSDRLAPDAPPTVEYRTWPGVYRPPFHFGGRYPGLPQLNAPAAGGGPLTAARIERLARDAQQLADQDEIENLQRIYGFYIDKGLWSEAAALFTADATYTIQGRGQYRGNARILEYLRAIGPEGLQPGRLYEHMQLQPVTHVGADGRTARGRWQLFAQLAKHGEFHEWATGVYENGYRKEGGVWKIHRLHLYPTMVSPYESGWGKASLPASRFEPSLAQDAPAATPSTYERSFVAPFHYPHPVRGAQSRRDSRSSTRVAPADFVARLDAAERQITAAEDRESIVNVQMAYGYYHSTKAWDDLAELFAQNGTIEVAMRGVYVGKPSVRRSLDLYGEAVIHDGELHNHMSFQPVIHVAADGRTATLRSRSLSIMGNYERNGSWIGGSYLNIFVKENGRWLFLKDQQINTYFSGYEAGWKDLAQRGPPGINNANPPDRPPSMPFDLYPKNFLIPFPYPNPVTGKPYQAPAGN